MLMSIRTLLIFGLPVLMPFAIILFLYLYMYFYRLAVNKSCS